MSPADVARRLREHPEISHVAVVHHETTTGLLNPVEALADVAAAAGRRLIVDATSSLFGEPLDVAHEGIDFVTASANKCLQAIPGISFVLGRRAALEALAGREARTVYLDLHQHWVTQERDNTPFTPAVQVLHAMREALIELEEEGVAGRIARYAENCRVLRRGMAALGFSILVPEGARSSILTTFRLHARADVRRPARRHEAPRLHHLRGPGGDPDLRLPRLEHGDAHAEGHGRGGQRLRGVLAGAGRLIETVWAHARPDA